MEDGPYDEPWIAQGSCSDNTIFKTAAGVGDKNTDSQERGLRLKSLHLDRMILAGVGEWAGDIDA